MVLVLYSVHSYHPESNKTIQVYDQIEVNPKPGEAFESQKTSKLNQNSWSLTEPIPNDFKNITQSKSEKGYKKFSNRQKSRTKMKSHFTYAEPSLISQQIRQTTQSKLAEADERPRGKLYDILFKINF